MDRRSINIFSIFLYIILGIIAIIQVYPIFWVVSSSIKPFSEFISKPSYSLPESLYLGNYITALATGNIPRAYLNSIFITIMVLTLEVLISCPAAFAIGKLDFKASGKLLSFFLMGMMIPVFVCLIPMFRVYTFLGIRNTYWSVVLPQLGFGLPLSIYMYVSFLKFVPDSLLEASLIDGANSLQIYVRIVFPLLKNATATILTFKFIWVWNEFTYANTFLTSRVMKTLPIMLRDYAGEEGLVNWGATYAAITLAILPTLIIYFLLSKNVTEGIAMGALKS